MPTMLGWHRRHYSLFPNWHYPVVGSMGMFSASAFIKKMSQR